MKILTVRKYIRQLEERGLIVTEPTEVINQMPVQRCQYCGSDDLGLGWQHGEAIVTFKKHGLLGNRLRYLICRRCGAVVYQWVAEPHKFPPIRNYIANQR